MYQENMDCKCNTTILNTFGNQQRNKIKVQKFTKKEILDLCDMKLPTHSIVIEYSEKMPELFKTSKDLPENLKKSSIILDPNEGLIHASSNVTRQRNSSEKTIAKRKIIPTSPFTKSNFTENPIERVWYYIDELANIQGPFTSLEMDRWFENGYFFHELLIRFREKNDFIKLIDLFGKTEIVIEKVIDETTIERELLTNYKKRMMSDHHLDNQAMSMANHRGLSFDDKSYSNSPNIKTTPNFFNTNLVSNPKNDKLYSIQRINSNEINKNNFISNHCGEKLGDKSSISSQFLNRVQQQDASKCHQLTTNIEIQKPLIYLEEKTSKFEDIDKVSQTNFEILKDNQIENSLEMDPSLPLQNNNFSLKPSHNANNTSALVKPISIDSSILESQETQKKGLSDSRNHFNEWISNQEFFTKDSKEKMTPHEINSEVKQMIDNKFYPSKMYESHTNQSVLIYLPVSKNESNSISSTNTKQVSIPNGTSLNALCSPVSQENYGKYNLFIDPSSNIDLSWLKENLFFEDKKVNEIENQQKHQKNPFSSSDDRQQDEISSRNNKKIIFNWQNEESEAAAQNLMDSNGLKSYQLENDLFKLNEAFSKSQNNILTIIRNNNNNQIISRPEINYFSGEYDSIFQVNPVFNQEYFPFIGENYQQNSQKIWKYTELYKRKDQDESKSLDNYEKIGLYD